VKCQGFFPLIHPQFFTPRKNTPDNSKSYMKPINTHWIKQNVIPAEAGIHSFVTTSLDSRLRGNDKCGAF